MSTLNLRRRELSAEEYVREQEERYRIWQSGKAWITGYGLDLYENALHHARPEQLERILASVEEAIEVEGAPSARTARPL